MSQKAVESILGRLITDAEFRGKFFEQPALICRDNGLDLTAVELDALLAIEPDLLTRMGLSLDSRIVRAAAITSIYSLSAEPPQNLKKVRPSSRTRRRTA
jgi:hypothetical protein